MADGLAESGSQSLSGSVVKSSDADGTVEVDDEETASDLSESTANLSLDPLCILCRERDNSVTVASLECKDCNKQMCDSCIAMHNLLLKNHAVTKLRSKPCTLCEQKDNTTKANWRCGICDKFMCDDCKSWHGMFFKDHMVMAITAKKKANSTSSTTAKMQIATDSAVNAQQPVPQGVIATTQPEFKHTLNLVSTKSVLAPCEVHQANITGSAFLPDGRLLLVDNYKKSLKLFGNDFAFIEEQVFDHEPWDVAVYDTSEISVSIAGKRIVRLCASKGMQIKSCLDVKANGLAYTDKYRLAVTNVDEKSFIVVSVEGKVLLRVSQSTNQSIFTVPHYVAVDVTRSRAYVSDSSEHKVTAICLSSGNVVFTYQNDDLPCPYGLAIDQTGYIYVCTFLRTENIRRICPNGDDAGSFVVSSKTKTLTFKPNSSGVVAAGYSNELSLYKLI